VPGHPARALLGRQPPAGQASVSPLLARIHPCRQGRGAHAWAL